MKVIIFDFDGTIADSFNAVLRISNRLAAEFGYPSTSPEAADQLKHLSSREILRRSNVALWKLPFLVRRFQIELNREICQLHSIAGIKEALLALKQQGDQLGIVTSNSKENVAEFLTAQGWDNLFDFVDTGLTLFGKGRIIQRILKQHNLPRELAIYVGDETRDIEAARKIAIPVIAVSWGFNSKQALATHAPDALIDRPSELVDAVKQVAQKF